MERLCSVPPCHRFLHSIFNPVSQLPIMIRPWCHPCGLRDQSMIGSRPVVTNMAVQLAFRHLPLPTSAPEPSPGSLGLLLAIDRSSLVSRLPSRNQTSATHTKEMHASANEELPRLPQAPLCSLFFAGYTKLSSLFQVLLAVPSFPAAPLKRIMLSFPFLKSSYTPSTDPRLVGR